MALHPLFMAVSLALMLVLSHAALPPERYWASNLPNAPMPRAVTDLLQPDGFMDKKSTDVGAGKGMGKPVDLNIKSGRRPFAYRYAANENQLHDDPNIALFFLEKGLTVGRTMGLQFTEASNGATFLPRQIADSVPFSSNKLPEILKKFSVKPGTAESKVMKETISDCEEQGIEGEEKYCATSLESMIDFSISKLGKEIHAVSTEVDKRAPLLQKYTIAGVVKKMEGDESVACHKLQYQYAVFYCHKTEATSAYMVPLVGADGTRARAVAICHKDTSAWNPKHLAFQVLKVKPGTVPVCHFLPQDHIVWVQN